MWQDAVLRIAHKLDAQHHCSGRLQTPARQMQMAGAHLRLAQVCTQLCLQLCLLALLPLALLVRLGVRWLRWPCSSDQALLHLSKRPCSRPKLCCTC